MFHYTKDHCSSYMYKIIIPQLLYYNIKSIIKHWVIGSI